MIIIIINIIIIFFTATAHFVSLNPSKFLLDFLATVKHGVNKNLLRVVALPVSTLVQVKTFPGVSKPEQMAAPVLLERTSHYSFMVCVSLQLIVYISVVVAPAGAIQT